LKWVNDTSEKHWAILANEEINKKYYWICLRYEIDYLGETFYNDKIVVTIRVDKSKGVRSIRHAAIVNNKKVIAKAETTQCLIDSKTQKPTRVSSEILDLLYTK
jgi:acyl-CoA thioester hydrolase